jgi:hypothetical protein
VIGGTVYPGLTLTAGTIWWYVNQRNSFDLVNVIVSELIHWFTRLLNSLNIPLSVETVCVFTAPIFSANASWATYLLTKVAFYGRTSSHNIFFSSENYALTFYYFSIGSKGHWSWTDGSSHFGYGKLHLPLFSFHHF